MHYNGYKHEMYGKTGESLSAKNKRTSEMQNFNNLLTAIYFMLDVVASFLPFKIYNK